MPQVFKIKGFTEYEIVDKILYRKGYKTKDRIKKWQYRNKRKINITTNNGIPGYILNRNNKRKWYSQISLRHRLIRVIDYSI